RGRRSVATVLRDDVLRGLLDVLELPALDGPEVDAPGREPHQARQDEQDRVQRGGDGRHRAPIVAVGETAREAGAGGGGRGAEGSGGAARSSGSSARRRAEAPITKRLDATIAPAAHTGGTRAATAHASPAAL